MKDIVKIILQKGYINMFSTCLIDQRGFGIMLYEELKLQTSHILGLSLIPINYSANEVYTFVSTCDSQLNNIIVNFALNSHLDAKNNIEFIKMYNEINELKDIKLQLHQSNQFRLELKNKQRAICLLWYLMKYPMWRNI
jgi:hypothetical protein